MSFKQVVSKYGYPVISKKVSRSLHDLQNPTSKNVNIRNLYLTGITSTGRKCKSRKLAKKYYPLINADFRIHNRCCDKMKKEPLHKYEKDSSRTSAKESLHLLTDLPTEDINEAVSRTLLILMKTEV